MKLQARKSLYSCAAVDHTPFAYHGAEVGAGGEPETGAAGGGAKGGRKGSALLADEGGLESRSLETVKRSGEKRACKGRAAGANGGELLSSSSEGRAEG